jgi:predicted outer membrane protein
MSKAKTLGAGLTVAAALLMLSACATRDDITGLDNRVAALESRANAAEAKVSAAQAAVNQCTTTCQDVQARAERMSQMYQQSLRK